MAFEHAQPFPEPAPRQARFAAFVEEVKRRWEHEEERKETAHFAGKTPFDPGALTMDDMKVWEKLDTQTLTRDELELYEVKLGVDVPIRGVDINDEPSRRRFLGLVRERATRLFLKQEYNEVDRAKRAYKRSLSTIHPMGGKEKPLIKES